MLLAVCGVTVVFGCTGTGGSDGPVEAASRRVSAEQRFPLPDGMTGLAVRVHPGAERLAVRDLVVAAVQMPGVSAAEADYDAGTVRVIVDGIQRATVREALLGNTDVVAAIELVGGT